MKKSVIAGLSVVTALSLTSSLLISSLYKNDGATKLVKADTLSVSSEVKSVIKLNNLDYSSLDKETDYELYKYGDYLYALGRSGTLYRYNEELDYFGKKAELKGGLGDVFCCGGYIYYKSFDGGGLKVRAGADAGTEQIPAYFELRRISLTTYDDVLCYPLADMSASIGVAANNRGTYLLEAVSEEQGIRLTVTDISTETKRVYSLDGEIVPNSIKCSLDNAGNLYMAVSVRNQICEDRLYRLDVNSDVCELIYTVASIGSLLTDGYNTYVTYSNKHYDGERFDYRSSYVEVYDALANRTNKLDLETVKYNDNVEEFIADSYAALSEGGCAVTVNPLKIMYIDGDDLVVDFTDAGTKVFTNLPYERFVYIDKYTFEVK